MQGTSDFRWLVYKFLCKTPSQLNPLPVFQPCMFTFTSAAKDKSYNGEATTGLGPANPEMKLQARLAAKWVLRKQRQITHRF